MQEFTVLAGCRDLLQRNVVVFDSTYEPLVLMDADARLFLRISLRDFEGSIRAAVVYDNVLPVLVSLGQDALDALGKILLAVIDGSQDGD